MQSTGRSLGQGGVGYDLFRSLAAFHLQRPGHGKGTSKVSSLQPGRGVLQSTGMAAEQRLWEDRSQGQGREISAILGEIFIDHLKCFEIVGSGE